MLISHLAVAYDILACANTIFLVFPLWEHLQLVGMSERVYLISA
ncbi:hypothetical protein RintRC_5072 [Richelia intracellularis]|nr:hypothetical protein RintRC_5072 [Richelia intracellularis]